MKKTNLWIAFLLILPMLAGLACRFTAKEPTPAPEVVVAPEVAEPVEAPTTPPVEEPVIVEETAEEPVEVPTEPPAEEPFQDLVRLEKSVWVQDEASVFVAFFFQNPNSNLIFEDVEYTVYLYDSNDVEISSDSSYVRWIFPEQTFGIAFTFYLSDESVQVDSATVDWEYDSTFPADGFANPFTVSDVRYWENNNFPMVTGSISNADTDTYTDVRANIICYDSAGEIVGGGYKYIEFIPGEGYMGFAAYVDAYAEVASVEVFPTFSYSSLFYEGENIWDVITLVDSHFYEGDWGNILGGVVIRNDAGAVLHNTIVYTTAYDEAGLVTSSGSINIGILLPGQILGVTPWILTPPDGTNTVNYDVLILPGEVEEGYELTDNPFVVNRTTITGDYDNYVLVNFTNTYSKQVSDLDVYVQLYDAEGKIIGGGSDWTTEPIAAGQTAEVEVYIDYADSKTIDRVEAWVVPNIFSEFE